MLRDPIGKPAMAQTTAAPKPKAAASKAAAALKPAWSSVGFPIATEKLDEIHGSILFFLSNKNHVSGYFDFPIPYESSIIDDHRSHLIVAAV